MFGFAVRGTAGNNALGWESEEVNPKSTGFSAGDVHSEPEVYKTFLTVVPAIVTSVIVRRDKLFLLCKRNLSERYKRVEHKQRLLSC